MELVELKIHIKQVRGVSYGGNDSIDNPKDGYLSVLRSNNINEGSINFNNLKYVPNKFIKPTQLLRKGDILITASTGSIKVIGKNGAIEKDYNGSFGAFCKVVRPLETINSDYLKHFFQTNYYRKTIRGVINGANINNIKNEHLDNLKIPLPSLKTQKKIATILDEADKLRQLNKKLIQKYELLTQSLFLEMFGDPVLNPLGWEKTTIKNFGIIKTGNTPSRRELKNYSSDYIEWMKTDNIKTDRMYLTKAKEYLSEYGLEKGRFVEKNSLLVCCIAGSLKSIGRASLTKNKVSFNQQINAIQPYKDVSYLFLYFLFKNSLTYIQDHASNGMKRMLNKRNFENIKMIKPPIHLQNQFAAHIKIIETQKAQAQKALTKADDLFNSLLQKAFKGELVNERL